jgi:spermidine synthase
LLVDIKGIEAAFLDSEERLATAMVDTVKSAGLTMLSYHCHKLIPMGVSCVGVLLESHISFHTWPTEGVITLDLFTCGSNPLIPVVPTIKELFGIPRENDGIVTQWSHELRGFRSKKAPNKENQNYALLDHNSDLSQMIWSPMDCSYKEQVYSGLTDYQRVDLWDVVSLEEQPSHDDVLQANLEPNDKRWTTSELVKPTRYLFLDGVLQSDNTTHKEYHEALVHPSMFSHASPKNVAIIGGAEGATLREVLKHSTIEQVTMIEIDQELMDISQKYMPQLSDCSNLSGRAANCFDDSKLNLIVKDAKEYYLGEPPKSRFDVVIVDAIEPEMSSAISKDLYENPELWENILDSLTDDGILAIQIGYAPTITDPKPDLGYNAPREILFKTLENLPSVKAMFVYEDSHVGFLVPKSFMIVCKSSSCRSRFYSSPDDVNLKISQRIVPTTSEEKALQYFDGVTQIYYQVAPKAWETIYCRREPTPFECDYRHLDFSKDIFEFKVNASEDEQVFDIRAQDGKETSTRVFAKVDIPKGSYIMADHAASSLQLSHKTLENLQASTDSNFVDFVNKHGHESMAAGSQRRLVEIGASYFIRIADSKEDANIGRWIPAHPQGKRPKYSPVYERHRLSFDVFMIATKDIAKGEELVKFKHMWDEE